MEHFLDGLLIGLTILLVCVVGLVGYEFVQFKSAERQQNVQAQETNEDTVALNESGTENSNANAEPVVDIQTSFTDYVEKSDMELVDSSDELGQMSDRAEYFKTGTDTVNGRMISLFVPKNEVALDVYYEAMKKNMQVDTVSQSGYDEKVTVSDDTEMYTLFYRGNNYILSVTAPTESSAELAINSIVENTK